MAETFAEVQKSIARYAEESFAGHVLTVEGPNEWRCGAPGTGIMAFRVLCRPGMIAVWGDLGEWVLRVSDRNPVPWIRGAVRSPGYLLEKVKAGERKRFYPADAMALLDDPETAESWGVDRVAKIREGIEWADPLTQERWLEACLDADLDDPPLVEYPTSAALWLVELLRKFVALEAELPRVYNGPSPLALAVVDEIEESKAPDRFPRPATTPTVLRHRCIAATNGGGTVSYYLTVKYPLAPRAEEKQAPAPRLVEPVVLDGFGDPIVADGVYLISDDRSRDNVIWWNPNSAGYTGSVDRAGRYTGQEAAAICRRARGVAPTNLFDNPVAWPEARLTGDLVSRIIDRSAPRRRRRETMEKTEIKNAVITDARFDTERWLTAWIYLDYGGSGQGFGGWLLYGPKGWKAHGSPGNHAGHFIWRVLEIAGVDDWSKLKGKTIRARCSWSRVEAIGHIVKDDWFDPAADFAQMRVPGE